MFKGIN